MLIPWCQSKRYVPPLRLLCAFIVVLQALSGANQQANAERNIDFQNEIRPILVAHCYECHGPDSEARQAELRLDRSTGLASHNIIVPGVPGASELVHRVSSTDDSIRMPPKEKPGLSGRQIQLLHDWIAGGASFQAHWAYEPPKRPQIPIVADRGWIENPIDAFVAMRLQTLGLHPARRASDRQLLRRISLLVRGLPPTPAEILVIDSRHESLVEVIDRWLMTPEFGERMAQDWLDAARYADTAGHAADKPRTMWLFRDWVIDAINRDMPFDKFTVEQLAGDMLAKPTTSQLVATGFHRNSMQALGNNPRKEEFRVKGIVDRLETTGRVWLGTTLACAECHDHKYDPISTREYYELFAIFNNVPHLGEKFEVHGPQLEVKSSTNHSVIAQVMAELPQRRVTRIHVRGDFENPGERVIPNVPAILCSVDKKPVTNRLEFAKWLVDESHPLTARVQVNRIWQHYFGHGLVRTPDDFGVRGQRPTHPQLLDWLAVEFMESGWSVKHVHRLILNSATFQQSSIFSPQLKKIDPDNRWLARFPRRRASAEVIRDTILSVSGQLVLQIGGRSVYPHKPVGVDKFRDETAGEWKQDAPPYCFRRGIYVFWQRTSPYPSMTLFDATSRERCTVKRAVTNTPLQSLALMNDPVYVAAANALASHLMSGAHGTSQRIELLFRLAVNRGPSKAERDRFQHFYDQSITQGFQELNAWSQLTAVMLNLDEVISIE